MDRLHQHAIYPVNTSLSFLTNGIKKSHPTVILYMFLPSHIMLNRGGKA